MSVLLSNHDVVAGDYLIPALSLIDFKVPAGISCVPCLGT